jgi:hypothetical protein
MLKNLGLLCRFLQMSLPEFLPAMVDANLSGCHTTPGTPDKVHRVQVEESAHKHSITSLPSHGLGQYHLRDIYRVGNRTAHTW